MTSAPQRERLDFLLDRLAKNDPFLLGLDQNDEPVPLGLDQKNDAPVPPVSTKKNDWLSSERWLSIKRWLLSSWLSSKRWLSVKRPSLGNRSSRALIASSYLIPFCIGVAVTLAWQSYGTRSTDQQLKTMSLDLAVVRQSVDQLDLTAVRQSVDQLTAKVQQMAGDIAAQQAILRRVSAPPPAAPPAPRRTN